MASTLNFDPSKPQTCYICLEEVSPKEEDSRGINDCATCENGHYLHRHCWDKMTKNICGMCGKPILNQCFNYYTNDYAVAPRKGGKKSKRQRNKRHRKSRKSKK